MTSCEDPYIGEESISRPPAPKKLRITSAQESRATGSLPTLKVIQLPSPMTGIVSPLEGIVLDITGFARAEPMAGHSMVETPAAASARRNRRRL